MKNFSQKSRLASNGQNDLNYLLGMYFSNENLVRNFGRGFVGNTTTTRTLGSAATLKANVPMPRMTIALLAG